MENEVNQKQDTGKKPFYKRWWFWLIIVVIGMGLLGAIIGGTTDSTDNGSHYNNNSQSQSQSQSTATLGEKNALRRAQVYLRYSAFSRQGLIEQLEFEEYSLSEATYAVNNCGANWNEQAKKKAAQYLRTMAFSRQELIEQLEFEGFTHAQAVYGAEANGY